MRLPKLTPADLDAEQQVVYDSITGGERAKEQQYFPLRDQDGALNGPFGAMLHAPQLGLPLQALGSAIRFHTELTDRVREIAILRVAQATGSEFEWWAHARIGRAVGLTDTEIEQISAGDFQGTDEYEQTCYKLCQILLQSNLVSDAEFENAARVLTERTMLELTVLVGYYRTLAQTMALFDIGIPEEHVNDL